MRNRICASVVAVAGLALAACAEGGAAEGVGASGAEVVVGPLGLIHPICTPTNNGEQWRGLGTAIYTDHASGKSCVLSSLNLQGDTEFDPADPDKPTALRVQAVTSAFGSDGCAPPEGTAPGAIVGHARWVWAAQGAYDGTSCQVFPLLDEGAWESEMRFVDRDDVLLVVETAPEFLPNKAVLANPIWLFNFVDNQPGRAQFSVVHPGPHYHGGDFIMVDPACTVAAWQGRFGLHTCDTIASRGGGTGDASAGAVINNRFDFDYDPADPQAVGPFQTTGFHLGRGPDGLNRMVSVSSEADFLRRFWHTASPVDPPVPPSGGAAAASVAASGSKEPWPRLRAAAEAQVGPADADLFCTNSQCFDGGDGPPKGNGWDFYTCKSKCTWCTPNCKNYCSGPSAGNYCGP